MSQNEPIVPTGDDRTILVPQPGGRRAAAAPLPLDEPVGMQMGAGTEQLAMQSAELADAPAPPIVPVQLHGNGLNPLVRAAHSLLNLIVPLCAMTTCASLEDLREQLVRAIRNFESDLRACHVDPDLIAASRYVLCTFLDETISGTPWGSGGAWAAKSLLVAFHNEAWGGEKVFVILQRLSQNPRTNLHALELIYLCLALGLDGRYGVRENGREQIETLRERLRQMIQTQRGVYERDLSQRWRGAVSVRKSLMETMPTWVIAAITGAVLVMAHLSLSYTLSRASDPVYADLTKVHVNVPAPAVQPVVTTEPPPQVPRLAGFLAQDVARGLVTVTDTADRSTVTLRGDGVFASASADIMPEYEPLMERIADALKAVPGKVIVIGHTDDQRSFSARFPSNWELSKARAASVIKLLAATAGPAERYTVVGRGETEPLVPNDTPANRARNRRVDIVLLTPASAGREGAQR